MYKTKPSSLSKSSVKSFDPSELSFFFVPTTFEYMSVKKFISSSRKILYLYILSYQRRRKGLINPRKNLQDQEKNGYVITGNERTKSWGWRLARIWRRRQNFADILFYREVYWSNFQTFSIFFSIFSRKLPWKHQGLMLQCYHSILESSFVS